MLIDVQVPLFLSVYEADAELHAYICRCLPVEVSPCLFFVYVCTYTPGSVHRSIQIRTPALAGVGRSRDELSLEISTELNERRSSRSWDPGVLHVT